MTYINMFKYSFVACCLLFFSGCKFLFGPSEDRANMFIIGTNSGFPPYEGVNEQGELEGFDIDLAFLLGKAMKKKVVIKDMSFEGLILALKQGKVDMILAGISITPTRKKEIAMIHYHGKPMKTFSLAFWNEIPKGIVGINDLQQLENRVVCAQAGNIQAEIVSTYNFLNVKYLDAIADLIMEIKFGKAIACALDYDVAVQIQKKYSEVKLLNIAIPKKLQIFGYGIGINKKNKKLIKQIVDTIKQFKQNDILEKLEQKWFKGDDHAGA